MDLNEIIGWVDYGYLVQDIELTHEDFASCPFICKVVTPEALFFYQEDKKRYLKVTIAKERDKSLSYVYKIWSVDTKDISPTYLEESNFMIERIPPDFDWLLKFLLAAYLIDMYVGQIEMYTLLTDEDKQEMEFAEQKELEKTANDARAKIGLVRSMILRTMDFNDMLRELNLPM